MIYLFSSSMIGYIWNDLDMTFVDGYLEGTIPTHKNVDNV